MEKLAFATLIAYIARLAEDPLEPHDIEHIEKLVTSPPSETPSAANVRNLIDHLAGNRKIDAIREFRVLTGDGLKEAKDAIERIYHPVAASL